MSKLCILIVEDEENWGSAIAKVISGLGGNSQIDVTTTCEGAKNKLARNTYDLAIVDLSLEKSTSADKAGMDLLRLIHDKYQDCATIVLTALATPTNTKVALRNYGAYDLIEKDSFAAAELLRTARDAIRDARWHRAERAKEKRYVLSITIDRNHLVGAQLSGPDRHAAYRCHEPRTFDAADLSRRTDNLNLFTLQSLPEIWRPELHAIGKAVVEILEQDPRVSAELQTGRALVDHRSELWLEFSGSPETLGLPFELLHYESDYIVTSHVVSRRIESLVSQKPGPFHSFLAELTKAQDPLRILLACANVDGNIPAVETEIDVLASLLQMELDQLGISHQIDVLKDPEYDELVNALQTGRYHLFHYAGHGRFDDQLPEISGLVLQDGSHLRTLTANDLELIVRDSALRMMYLSCCLGARSSAQVNSGIFQGVMHALAQADVPYVLGYRWTIDDQQALDMAEAFYTKLWQALSPGDALLYARRCAARGPRGRDADIWASAVLLAQNR